MDEREVPVAGVALTPGVWVQHSGTHYIIVEKSQRPGVAAYLMRPATWWERLKRWHYNRGFLRPIQVSVVIDAWSERMY